MSTWRWIEGEPNYVDAPVRELTVIEPGDLVYLDDGFARPITHCESLVEAFDLMPRRFLGVSRDHYQGNPNERIRVATSGVFELDFPMRTARIGDLVAFYWSHNAGRLMVQSVDLTENILHAIGTVNRHQPQRSNSVHVRIFSRAIDIISMSHYAHIQQIHQ